MENKDYYFNDVKGDLKAAFEAYYDLIFGSYDLEKPQDLKIRELSKVVKNEVFEKGGKFYNLFKKIGKVEDEIYDLEDEVKKNDDSFGINEGLSVQIRDLYDNAIREISKLMFMYGVRYGKNLEKCLNEFTINHQKEKINSKFEYSVDYSQNSYFDEEKEKDDTLDNLIREALKLSENNDKKIEIDQEKIKKFCTLKQKLNYIAVENSTIMTIKMLPNSTKIIIELESETLDFDTEQLKNKFIDVLKYSKFVCFETRLNGKLLLTVEVDVCK